ncbi:hypothetical protein GW17_00008453 [Ensete ventricosum]|nr:hypothetical protein GW17_00008453 [Ensete ventricosum]
MTEHTVPSAAFSSDAVGRLPWEETSLQHTTNAAVVISPPTQRSTTEAASRCADDDNERERTQNAQHDLQQGDGSRAGGWVQVATSPPCRLSSHPPPPAAPPRVTRPASRERTRVRVSPWLLIV